MNIATASQAKQRVVANEWAGDNWSVENAPLMLEDKEKKGRYQIHSAPWAYVEDLSTSVLTLLDNLEK